jgi:hypothetical protein
MGAPEPVLSLPWACRTVRRLFVCAPNLGYREPDQKKIMLSETWCGRKFLRIFECHQSRQAKCPLAACFALLLQEREPRAHPYFPYVGIMVSPAQAHGRYLDLTVGDDLFAAALQIDLREFADDEDRTATSPA